MVNFLGIETDSATEAAAAWVRKQYVILSDGTFTEPDIEVVREAAIDAINQWAGEQRSRHFTDITAQDSVYADKEQEARRCLSDPEPTTETYPYCEIERSLIEAATGETTSLHTAAELVVQVANDKRQRSVAIEAKRRRVGAQAQAAQSVAEIEAALAGLM